MQKRLQNQILLVFSILCAFALACSSDSENTPVEDDSADGDGETVDNDENGDEPADGDMDDENDVAIPTTVECVRDRECTRLMVAAHRGYAAIHPENSQASFRHAAEVGADFVELDVWHTADDGLVLMHKSDVSLFTDGTGEIIDLTLEQIGALTLTGCEQGNEESCKVPTLTEALALADELDFMLIVDLKTDRTDLVLAAIQQNNATDLALLNGDWQQLQPLLAQEQNLLVMPRIETESDCESILSDDPGILVMDIEALMPDADVTVKVVGAGVKAQQDAMVGGDLQAEMYGDLTGWKQYVDAGVTIMQTQQPQFLAPAAKAYNENGVFPESTE